MQLGDRELVEFIIDSYNFCSYFYGPLKVCNSLEIS